jgi:transposase-like protein
MSVKYSESFKKQAIQKALRRGPGVTLESLCKEWGVSRSALTYWLKHSKAQTLMKARDDNESSTIEKRPQDWSADEKLALLIACGTLDETGISEACREKGIYPYHLDQWKSELVENLSGDNEINSHAETKHLKNENRELRKALRRKEKALAEAAALLILQKKVNAIWGEDEDDLL